MPRRKPQPAPEPTPTTGPRARGAVADAPPRYPDFVDRYALLVGISSYQHATWNLKYAHRDALDLAALLRSPSGGGFQHVQLLIDAEATTAAVTRALRSFLGKPGPEDILLLFFSCHGGRAADGREVLYLYTHDTDPADIAGTALPMREINQCIADYLRAERVVILADTCHSGGVMLPGQKGGAEAAGIVNQYLESVRGSRGGVIWMTSAATGEASIEVDLLGHGLFTHHLLEGMRGDADGFTGQPKDGRVSLGELYHYVATKVADGSQGSQHPVLSPSGDREFPMATTGGLDARRHLELGTALVELGWLVDDPGRFLAAERQLVLAAELARRGGATLPEAQVERARALLAAGRPEAAVAAAAALEGLEEPAPAELLARAALYRGLAEIRRHDPEAAAAAFEAVGAARPGEPELAWVAEYGAWCRRNVVRTRHALLVGINAYASPDLPPLRGCVHDVALMQRALVDACGFAPEGLRALTDHRATRAALLAALRELAEVAGPNDLVLVYFSGHALDEAMAAGLETATPGLYLITSDSRQVGGRLGGGIGYAELHALIRAIPGQQRILVLDTHPREALAELAAREGGYTLVFGAQAGQQAGETLATVEGQARPAGLFTRAFANELQHSRAEDLPAGQLLARTATWMGRDERGGAQRPWLVGPEDQPLLAALDVRGQLCQLIDEALLPGWARRGGPLVQLAGRAATALEAPFPGAWLALGEALVDRLDAETRTAETAAQATKLAAAARDCLARCLAQGGPEARAQLALARLALLDEDATAIAAGLRAAAAAPPAGSAVLPPIGPPRLASAPPALALEQALDLAGQLSAARRHALLIGIDHYPEPLPALRGAVRDVEELARILRQRHGFGPEAVTVLRDGEASRERILAAYSELARQAAEGGAYFHFSGYGSLTAGGGRTLVPADGRSGGVPDIAFATLERLAGPGLENLLCVLDCGHVRTGVPSPEDRSLPEGLAEAGEGPEVAGPEIPLPATGAAGAAGRLRLICASSSYSGTSSKPQALERATGRGPGAPVRGRLSAALGRLLAARRSRPLRYDDLAAKLRTIAGAQALGGGRQPVFGDVVSLELLGDALAALSRERSGPVTRTVEALCRQLLRQAPDPEARLNLGIALDAQGRRAEAERELRQAVEAYELAHGQAWPDGLYHLGRVLLALAEESGQARPLREAVPALQQARDAGQAEAGTVRLAYHLARALAILAESDILAEANEMWRQYLELGAPYGEREAPRLPGTGF